MCADFSCGVAGFHHLITETQGQPRGNQPPPSAPSIALRPWSAPSIAAEARAGWRPSGNDAVNPSWRTERDGRSATEATV